MSTQAVRVASGTLRSATSSLLADPQVLARGHLLYAMFRGIHLFEWVTLAACSPETADLFHPDKPDSTSATAQAKWVCSRCPVLDECRTYIDAVEANLARSYWAGTFAGETARERARRRSAEAKEALADAS